MNYSSFRPEKRPVYFKSYTKYRGGAGFVRRNASEDNTLLSMKFGWKSGSYNGPGDPQLLRDVEAFTKQHKMSSTGGLLDANVTMKLLGFFDTVQGSQASIDFDPATNALVYGLDLSAVDRKAVADAAGGGGGGLSTIAIAAIAAVGIVGAIYLLPMRK